MGSYDKFAAKDMVNVGGYFPQTSLPYMVSELISCDDKNFRILKLYQNQLEMFCMKKE